jgi:hypothetical protein
MSPTAASRVHGRADREPSAGAWRRLVSSAANVAVRALLVLLVVVVLLGTGCGTATTPQVDFSSTQPTHVGADYGDVYQLWTRHGKVVHEFESALEVWATYKSTDYREAFVARYAEAYRLPPPDRELIRTGQREAEADAYEFMVTAQSANYRWNDLERKGSAWRVTLRDGLGHELYPEKIAYERLPETYEREFFPVKTPFTRLYTVRFSRHASEPARPDPAADGAATAGGTGSAASTLSAGTAVASGTARATGTAGATGEDGFVGERSGRLVLRIAGPYGSVDLVWSAQP